MTSPDISYRPSSVGYDTGCYDVQSDYFFRDDPVLSIAAVGDLPDLATSPDWEDRVRAEVLRRRLRICLPDGFPALYEVPDSPNQSRHLDPRPNPWVISPDIAMLEELLPDYQELWDAYTSQWGPGSRRVFAVGRLDELSPHGVCRPGTTPRQVIADALLTHDGMYARAPERLRRMHPRYDDWNRR